MSVAVSRWLALPLHDHWSATCDTLHAHSEVRGKLAAVLAPPEPERQHAALCVSATTTSIASSYASFSDPEGNRWLLQEVTSRLPGRV